VDILVWALRLPTNVEKAVRDLQDTLFRSWGLVSALALPVIVPLVCLRTPAGFSSERPDAAGLPVAARLRACGLAESGGCLVCGLEPRQSLVRLAQACRRIGPKGAAALRPSPLACARGIFLCFVEKPALAEVVAAESGALGGGGFPGLALSLLRITNLGSPDPWWSALAWEEVQRLPLRKGDPSASG
jgi:hypothetical protein